MRKISFQNKVIVTCKVFDALTTSHLDAPYGHLDKGFEALLMLDSSPINKYLGIIYWYEITYIKA